jgi:hypothetical protein
MPTINRRGLSWVEVLVIVVIIAAGLVLLMPYLIQTRTTSRVADCMNNQKQLALATLMYEEAQQRFPGYVNEIGGGPASWVVALLPYLDQKPLHGAWERGDEKSAYLPLLVCPADPPEVRDDSNPALSYVVNCGLPGDKESPADGVFFNHLLPEQPVTISLEQITQADGAQYTLMHSENIQAGRWTDTTKENVGMVWWREPGQCARINECRDAGDRPQQIRYARPSSFHEGGVVASFCDGHQQFIDERIDYSVYQLLMTPNSRAAGLEGTVTEDSFEPL